MNETILRLEDMGFLIGKLEKNLEELDRTTPMKGKAKRKLFEDIQNDFKILKLDAAIVANSLQR